MFRKGPPGFLRVLSFFFFFRVLGWGATGCVGLGGLGLGFSGFRV